MVQEANPNIRVAKRFRKKLEREIGVSSLVLFGSRSRGNFSAESDFDFLLVSNDFDGVPQHKRPAKLYGLWDEDYPLELICYTEKEFEEKKKGPYWGITRKALASGTPI